MQNIEICRKKSRLNSISEKYSNLYDIIIDERCSFSSK
ncbi:hypothetical protein T10_11256 [Trichinella papuae]|uniref:Uncharacterized protein n=1 Tax=Trichinella papuae TaxID=268474 RepID=A0A0V1LXZ2_9BILA|nr:hypothetical protein T10_11256 [Trichinella papuae]